MQNGDGLVFAIFQPSNESEHKIMVEFVWMYYWFFTIEMTKKSKWNCVCRFSAVQREWLLAEFLQKFLQMHKHRFKCNIRLRAKMIDTVHDCE